MKLPPFYLEEFWKKYEFTAPHILCSSVTECWSLKEILELSDEETKDLWERLQFGYTEVDGLPRLREEIALLYDVIASNQILTFAGAEEGIYCALQTLIEPGDHVVIAVPIYQSLEAIPRSLGAKITQVTLEAEKEWDLTAEDFKKAFQPSTKLVILNYPHSPTGALLKKDVFQEVVHLAKERNCFIFCDEVYRTLEFNEEERLPAVADLYEKGISLNVMSKAFGLPGLRIGWLACQDRAILERISSYKQYTTICNSAPSEILALIALKAKGHILGRNRKIMLKSYRLLEEFINRNSNYFSFVKPKAGTTAAVELLNHGSIIDFSEKLVNQTGILIMPMQVYGFEGNYFRIGFGKENTGKLLEMFEDALKRIL